MEFKLGAWGHGRTKVDGLYLFTYLHLEEHKPVVTKNVDLVLKSTIAPDSKEVDLE